MQYTRADRVGLILLTCCLLRDALKAQGVPNSELPPDVDARGYPVKQDQV